MMAKNTDGADRTMSFRLTGAIAPFVAIADHGVPGASVSCAAAKGPKPNKLNASRQSTPPMQNQGQGAVSFDTALAFG